MSALIWLAIVAVWGFVLIPMWLRHHDSAVEQRSAERFTTAMRVLSRRGSPRPEVAGASSAGEGHEVGATPVPRLSSPAGRFSVADYRGGLRGRGAARGGRRGAEDPSSVARRLDAEQKAMMRLRRQRLFVLLFAVPVSLVLAVVLGGTWILVHLLSDTGLAAYLIHLRRAAQAERRLRAARSARERWIASERAARRGGGAAVTGPGVAAVDDGSNHLSDREPDRFRRTDVEEAAAVTSPAAWSYPPSGLDAESAARWATEYAPVRLSDTLDGELTESERAVAQAETVDLGTLMDVAREQVEADERARADAAAEASEAQAAAERQWVIDGDVEAVQVHDEPAEQVTSHEPVPEPEVQQPVAYGGGTGTGTGSGSGTRSTYGRPAARQHTSKPGRVQVNPPGTHGGLTAPPGAATGAPAAAVPDHVGQADQADQADQAEPEADTTTPAAGAAGAAAAGGDPDELEELLRRHAVGS